MEPFDAAIELTIPADPRLLRLVRLVASGLASTAGFDVDELDDLRIAVDEAASALLEGGGDGPIPLRFDIGGGSVSMQGQTVLASPDALDQDRLELSTQILGAVCDEHQLEVVDGSVLVRISRRTGER